MSVTASRFISITLSGDIAFTERLSATPNTSSPGVINLLTLASGDNTLTKPAGGSAPTCITIIPPASNVIALLLKGAAGDTGIRLHNTDPTSIAFDSSVSSIILNAASSLVGVRVIWT